MSAATDLTAAIAAAEAAGNSYQSTAAQTAVDQGAVSAAQAKLDAANAQVSTDQKAQADAATQFNSALDNLIAAAQAAKITQ